MVNLLEELCPIPNIPEGGKALIGQLRGCAACGCTRLWRWTGPFPTTGTPMAWIHEVEDE